ncbi:bifunctional DNA primase/polymerase [Streptomyces sp. NBC_01498]|uniref:bifunctional DNA primase/polymerase n=1 Tax=Streptomyces sp. NBC_01498 TaxID=2975870 RepID=UPI002E7B372A|nr:bifunctional DNA primase/polymerase [Streptomyces sp. NBC_01498]WTL26756.1 bifunctional DNA primase/polymerase [Streptomyces sp. NBC_01498]
MSAWLRDESPVSPGACDERRTDTFDHLREHGRLREHGHDRGARITAAGAGWLASAGPYPRSTLALWADRPTAPGVLPCGTVFDVVNVPAVFGRRMLDRLWFEGPGSGPVATHRGRTMLFTLPGTAQRLPSLLSWEEWGRSAPGDAAPAVPPLICHGLGDAVTVPSLVHGTGPGPRWVVAPDGRHPWLPGPEVLLWACVRASRPRVRNAVARPRTGTVTSLPGSCS